MSTIIPASGKAALRRSSRCRSVLDTWCPIQGALLIGAAGLTLAASQAAAQSVPLNPGPFPFLRYEQTCRTLADLAKVTSEPFTYIPLGADPDYCLSFGGEVRVRYEHYTNEYAGTIGVPQENYLLLRQLLDADLHLGEHFRAFVQLGVPEVQVNEVLVPPVNRTGFDLAQGFLDLSSRTEFANDVTLRVGRQEIGLGSFRFVNVREGPDVRAAFDGFRSFATWDNGSRLDLILTRPTVNLPRNFDDYPDTHEIFGAAYYTMPLVDHVNLDGYYYYLSTTNGEIENPHPPGVRHTIGARLWGQADPWDYDTDVLFQVGHQGQSEQLGHQGQDEVLAGGIATKVGYSFSTGGEWWRPRLVLQANYFTGTRNPNSGVTNTFLPLYASPLNFSSAAFQNYQNIIDFYPGLKLHPTDRIAIQFGPEFTWRASTHDSVYFLPGIPIPGTADVRARYIGTNLVFEATWIVTPNIWLSTSLERLQAGPAITNAHGKSSDYAGFELRALF